MSIKYKLCEDSVQKTCKAIIDKHHKELDQYGLTVICMFADAGNDANGAPKPAVKLHGRPCAATIKKTSPQNRALGQPDAIINIDKHIWYDLDDIKQMALIDHELTHIDLTYEEDETERPGFTMRQHDWELSGFADVVSRWGKDAIEMMQLRKFHALEDGQTVFGFLDEKKQEGLCKVEAA